MSSNPMTTILLQIDDQRQRSAVADTLRQENFEVIGNAGESASQAVDAVLADHAVRKTPAIAAEMGSVCDQVALAAIGWEGPADVVLPEDVTDRELKLVCSLLVEITRLRRESTHRFHERTAMQQLAFSDALTTIPNRRAWDHESARQFEQTLISDRPLALAIIDLDQFKSVNDRYGHASGDEVLKSAARAISASVRASDFLARLGGDEFGLLLPDVLPTALPGVVERIRRSVATQCSRPVGPNVSASIGYAMRKDEASLTQLFERCDAALRQAKDNGRDRAIAG
jgi:diguanylate cyclase (GGDEF)-like protein